MEHQDDIIDMEIAEAGAPQKLSPVRIIWRLFISPAKGAFDTFANPYSGSLFNGIIFIVLTGFVTTMITYFYLAGDGEPVKFMTVAKLGFDSIIFLLLVSLLILLAGIINGKTHIGKAILTGGACGIIVSAGILFIYLLSRFTDQGIFSGLMTMDFSGFIDWFVFFILIFSFLLLFNTVFQSLRSLLIKDGAGFYLSPMIILIALYFSFKIAKML
jgi:hypothetical protein